MSFKNSIFKYLSFAFAAFVLLYASDARAGIIINRPLYIGLEQGLVGFWSFDGPDMTGNTALDRSGQGNNGTLTNGPRRIAGRIGQALEFDGVNDHVSTSDITAVEGTTLTVSAWVNAQTLRDYDSVVSKNASGNSSFYLEVAGASDGGSNDIALSPGGNYGYTTGNIHRSGSWEHWVMVFDGTKGSDADRLRLFFNGVQQQLTFNGAINATIPDNTYPVTIGADGDLDSSTFFPGSIDEVRIYNRALSPQEIKRLYNMGATFKINKPAGAGLEQGLVGYWSFDGPDVAGNIAHDRSPDAQDNFADLFSAGVAGGPQRVIGRIGQAIRLDGVDDTVDPRIDSSLLNIDVKTVSVWIKVDDFATNYQTIARENYSSTKNWTFEVEGLGNNRLVYDHVYSGQLGSWGSPVNSLGANTWHHVAVIYASTSVSNVPVFYIDGAPTSATEITPPTGSSFNGGDVFFGGATWDGSDILDFKGVLDDVRIYNRALSADEIRRLYNLGGTFRINKSLSTGTLKDGLVGHWTFDGPDMGTTSARDVSGQDNTGWLINGPRKVAGKIGQALDFDGVNDYVLVGAEISPPDEVTQSAWFKLDSVNTDNIIIYQDVLGQLATINDEFEWFHGSGCCFHDTINANLVVGRWFHVAVTFNEITNVVKIYLDGVEIYSASETGNMVSFGYDYFIGSDNGPATFFDGTIDDVRVYNRALSPDEIRRLYQMGR
jgi:hypothetical protein